MDPLTSTVRPPTNLLITVRIIKSLEFRNVKNYVYNVDLKATSPDDLISSIIEIINTTSSLRPYRGRDYNTLKIYSSAHGTKSMNLVINLGEEEKVLAGSSSLWDLGVRNESELSLFNYNEYLAFKENPVEKW